MSPNAWSSPTLRPSAEAEFISSASVLSPHNAHAPDRQEVICEHLTLSAAGDGQR
ncbi:hypothetical protein IQ268_22835 [Oculatella sp. LEGE 06141]|nr:hypothetical protein [Oculatella sp. LEGE 06141]